MADPDAMILCDIGNSRMHFFDGVGVVHLDHQEGLRRYRGEKVCFICVKEKLRRRIVREAPQWIDLSEKRLLPTAYEGMGIDRQAACLGVGHGVVIDAGSAITVDVMDHGSHLGGWIWPGLAALRRAYASVSPRLDLPLDAGMDMTALPQSTAGALSFGIFAPMVRMVREYTHNRPLVLTGGDAGILAGLFPEAKIDETVVFKGMKTMIKDNPC